MPSFQTEMILRPWPRWSLNLNQEEVEGVRFLGPSTERWKINYIQLAKQSCAEANQPHTFLHLGSLENESKLSMGGGECKELILTVGVEKVKPKEHHPFTLSEWRPWWSFYKAWRDCFRSHPKISLITPAKEIPRRHCFLTSTPQNLSKYIVLSTKQFISDLGERVFLLRCNNTQYSHRTSVCKRELWIHNRSWPQVFPRIEMENVLGAQRQNPQALNFLYRPPSLRSGLGGV